MGGGEIPYWTNGGGVIFIPNYNIPVVSCTAYQGSGAAGCSTLAAGNFCCRRVGSAEVDVIGDCVAVRVVAPVQLKSVFNPRLLASEIGEGLAGLLGGKVVVKFHTAPEEVELCSSRVVIFQ